jgi:hypothetical protein
MIYRIKLKKGDKWIINNYNGYTISNNGKITITPYTKLSYEITDIKKTDVKNNYMIGFKISYIISEKLFTEYDIALYNTINKKAFILEVPVNGDNIGLENLQILCNGNLRVKFYEASGLVYIADLKKVQNKN